MPTSKPRITVTLTEDQHAILRRISDAGGRSMSGVISEFMVVAQPTLERMADAFQQLKQDRDADHQFVADMLSGLHAQRSERDPRDQGKQRGKGDQGDHNGQQNLELGNHGVGSLPFPASSGSALDSANLTVGDGSDAIQYCASADTVRLDNLNSRESPRDEIEAEAVYGKQKKSASRKTKSTKK